MTPLEIAWSSWLAVGILKVFGLSILAVIVIAMAASIAWGLLRDHEPRPSQSLAGRAEPARGLSRSRMVRWFARSGDQGVVRGGNK